MHFKYLVGDPQTRVSFSLDNPNLFRCQMRIYSNNPLMVYVVAYSALHLFTFITVTWQIECANLCQAHFVFDQ